MPSADRLSRNIEAGDDNEWFERSEYWRTYRPPRGRGAPKKFKYREPLVLCGHGVRIRVDRGTLFVRGGFTHYPQNRDEYRFFPGDASLPDRIIVLNGSGGISFGALNWMTEQQITFVQLDWRGQVSFVSESSGYSANRKLVVRQLATRKTQRSIDIARWLIQEKIVASIKTISEILPESENRRVAISKLQKWSGQLIKTQNSNTISKILGIEGAAAAVYFQTWHGLPLRWSRSSRRPIPDVWKVVGPRTMGWQKRGQNARHPVNAMLNYGYGVLASVVRTELTSVGLDPGIGVMHDTKQNRIPLVYDLMEPLRPAVDATILRFALDRVFLPGDFSINKSGGCQLNPQLAKSVTSMLGNLGARLLVKRFLEQI